MGKRVAVIGGGITGLSACYELEKLGASEVVLFEARPRLGGKLQTLHERGFLVECAPDSIFTRQAEILDFIDELGLTDQVIEPAIRGYSIYLDGALRRIPPALARLGAIDAGQLDEFPHLSEEGKQAVLNEPDVPASSEEDESIRGFFSRRYGVEYSVKIAEPLFAGTHGGNAQLLSMEALFPSYRKLEREYGSLSHAYASGAMGSVAKFISFQGGVGQLGQAVADRLERTQIVYREVSGLEELSFDAVILAVPARRAGEILRTATPGVAEELGGFQAADSTIVSLGYDNEVPGLYGTGFLVPEGADQRVTGATWSSQKYLGRASEGQSLLRVFLRGLTSEDSILVAQEALATMAGVTATPSFCRIDVWQGGLPQYRLGHLKLVEGIEEGLRKLGPVFLAGQSYRGVGIPDCVSQGRRAAEFAISA